MTLYAASEIFEAPQEDTRFQEPLPGPSFRSFQLLRKHPYYGRAVPWEITLNNFAGSYGQQGPYESHFNRTASSTLDYRDGDALTLQLKSSDDTTLAWTNSAVSHCNIFGTMAFGIGGTADNALYSAILGSYTAHVYTPGSAITCLHPIVIGGATSAVRLLVGRAGASPQVLADLGATPTVSGTMHANLNPTWGLITSYLNATNPSTGTHLFYANGSIYTLAVTAAITDAPTVAGTASVYPNGGFAIGIIRWNGVDRAFWWMPQANATSPFTMNPVARNANGTKGRIIHTNLEGTDPQELKLPFLKDVVVAFAWRDGLFVSDEYSGYYVSSSETRNLHFARNWPNSGGTRPIDTIYGGWPMGNDLMVLYKIWDTSQSATASLGTEFYNWQRNTWSRCTHTNLSGVTAPSGVGAMPLDTNRRALYYFATTGAASVQSRWQKVPDGDHKVFDMRAVGSQNVLHDFESSGSWTSPNYTLPGNLGDYPSVITEIDMTQCDITTGGSGTIVKCEIACQSGNTSLAFSNTIQAQFADTDPIAERIRRFPRSRDAFNQFQVKVSITQGSTTNKTPNASPITIRGLTFIDGIVREPSQVIGEGWYR